MACVGHTSRPHNTHTHKHTQHAPAPLPQCMPHSRQRLRRGPPGWPPSGRQPGRARPPLPPPPRWLPRRWPGLLFWSGSGLVVCMHALRVRVTGVRAEVVRACVRACLERERGPRFPSRPPPLFFSGSRAPAAAATAAAASRRSWTRAWRSGEAGRAGRGAGDGGGGGMGGWVWAGRSKNETQVRGRRGYETDFFFPFSSAGGERVPSHTPLLPACVRA